MLSHKLHDIMFLKQGEIVPHFFIKSSDVNDTSIIIRDLENYNHIAKSLRAKCGESLLLIDENQIQYETRIVSITGKDITVDIKNSYQSNRKLNFELYLAQSPLRSDAQSLIIEKATELGVAGVYPVLTDNCALKKDVITKKISKWQKIMLEASKQCERADVPVCYDLTNINALCESKYFDYVIAYCERCSDTTLRAYCAENPQFFNNSKILVIIGPEGGFSEREFEYFRENNVPMLTLGNLILKAETAVTVGLGNIVYEYGNIKRN